MVFCATTPLLHAGSLASGYASIRVPTYEGTFHESRSAWARVRQLYEQDPPHSGLDGTKYRRRGGQPHVELDLGQGRKGQGLTYRTLRGDLKTLWMERMGGVEAAPREEAGAQEDPLRSVEIWQPDGRERPDAVSPFWPVGAGAASCAFEWRLRESGQVMTDHRDGGPGDAAPDSSGSITATDEDDVEFILQRPRAATSLGPPKPEEAGPVIVRSESTPAAVTFRKLSITDLSSQALTEDEDHATINGGPSISTLDHRGAFGSDTSAPSPALFAKPPVTGEEGESPMSACRLEPLPGLTLGLPDLHFGEVRWKGRRRRSMESNSRVSMPSPPGGLSPGLPELYFGDVLWTDGKHDSEDNEAHVSLPSPQRRLSPGLPDLQFGEVRSTSYHRVIEEASPRTSLSPQRSLNPTVTPFAPSKPLQPPLSTRKTLLPRKNISITSSPSRPGKRSSSTDRTDRVQPQPLTLERGFVEAGAWVHHCAVCDECASIARWRRPKGVASPANRSACSGRSPGRSPVRMAGSVRSVRSARAGVSPFWDNIPKLAITEGPTIVPIAHSGQCGDVPTWRETSKAIRNDSATPIYIGGRAKGSRRLGRKRSAARQRACGIQTESSGFQDDRNADVAPCRPCEPPGLPLASARKPQDQLDIPDLDGTDERADDAALANGHALSPTTTEATSGGIVRRETSPNDIVAVPQMRNMLNGCKENSEKHQLRAQPEPLAPADGDEPSSIVSEQDAVRSGPVSWAAIASTGKTTAVDLRASGAGPSSRTEVSREEFRVKLPEGW